MNIGILSKAPKIYSTLRLVEAAKNRGHEVEVIQTDRCFMNITSERPSVYYRDRILDHFDAIIPRIGASITYYGTAVLRQFEMMGVFSLNESVAISRSRDKLRSLQLLSRKGVGLPTTGFAHATRNTEELINLVGGPPLVIKLIEGTQGAGVVLAETMSAAESVIDAFRGLNANFIVQKFVKEARGTDLRCFVIGDRVVAAMLRKAREGEFRSNLHRGGSAINVKISPAERNAAVAAARAMGLNVAGVDLLRSDSGPLVMEVNSSPGLEGIEQATTRDIAGAIIEFLEKNAKPGKNRTRGQG